MKHWPPHLTRTLAVPRTTLVYNLEVSARRYPQRPALIFHGRTLTYRDLAEQVDALAAFLQQRCGVAPGDRVLVDLQNSPQFVIGYYAAMRADAVVVPANPMLRTAELEHLMRDSGATVAIFGQDAIEQFTPLPVETLRTAIVATYSDYADPEDDVPASDLVREPPRELHDPRLLCWREAIAAGGSTAPAPPIANADSIALLPYTSGTTGRPKGCIHTHSTLLAVTTAQIAWSGFTSDSVFLATMPLYHVTGMQGMMNAPIQAGAAIVLLPRWDRNAAIRLIERHRVTAWSGITTMIIDFLGDPQLKRHDLSSLTRIGGGGASMPEAVARRLKEVLGLDYIEGYGMSETAAPTHYNPLHRPKRQCAGLPLFGVDSRVLDLESGAELGPGERGEIVIAGPQVFAGYWNNPEETAAAFVEIEGKRFLKTGDIGYYDEDGYFFVTDRVKRMINAAGLKVWPTEVESVLYEHPGILECCVIGTRDARRGETVKVLIVPDPKYRGNLTAENLTSWARERMAAYKIPRVIEFVDSLPRTASGKVLWRELQEREDARFAGQS
ncbi:MAG TPA: long-chain-fatty-acid--CoA ligase [Burkholderiaceae bacterium]|nr:long-chain-fatty-acid--CoA ligase [Burkholderiaceae bacterium]